MRANSSVSESQQSTYHSATTSADRRIGSMATTSNSSDILGQPQDLPPTIKQILLHEERRTETRPVPSSAASSDDNCTQMSTSEQLKTYTIVDQIIFEMDYSNGCWRKLRRRVRLTDRASSTAEDSTTRTSNPTGPRERRITLPPGASPMRSMSSRAGVSASGTLPEVTFISTSGRQQNQRQQVASSSELMEEPSNIPAQRSNMPRLIASPLSGGTELGGPMPSDSAAESQEPQRMSSFMSSWVERRRSHRASGSLMLERAYDLEGRGQFSSACGR